MASSDYFTLHVGEMRISIFAILFLILASQSGNAQEKNLDYFFNLALRNSPQLKDYKNRLQINQIDSLRLRAGLGPQVNALSNDSYAPVINGTGQDEAITNGANIYASMIVSKEIISKRNLQNRLDAVALQKLSIQNPAKITEQELRKGVADQYIAAYGLSQQAKFLSDELQLLRREEVLLKRLAATGVYKQTDYLAFMVLLQQQDLQLSQINSQYKNAFRGLNYLCGVTDTTIYRLVDPALTPEKLPELRNSIFYQPFVTDSLNLVVGAKSIDFSYQPKLNLFGEAAYNSSLVYQPWRNFGPNVGINLSIPIYDGRQRKMQHNQLAFSEQTRRNYRDFFTRQYSQQINQLILQMADNRNLKEKINKQVSYAAALVEANRKLLETGEVSVTEYVLALTNLLTTKSLLIQNETEKYQLVNQLNYWCREK